ncbi:Hsp70 family protein [Pseudomonas aeruginosa]|nr:Hsp70 family protein [Pseudomonas aeruginosa]
MALPQIAEPGQSPSPMSVAWRLGSTWVPPIPLVAAVRSAASPSPLPDAQGRLIPPFRGARYHAERAEVGEKPRAAAAEDPFNTVISVKRLMGRGLEDVKQLGEQLPSRFRQASAHALHRGPYGRVEESRGSLGGHPA